MITSSQLTNDHRTRPARLLVLLALALALSALAGAQTAKYPQTIVFMTDFGVVDDSVAHLPGRDVFDHAGACASSTSRIR